MASTNTSKVPIGTVLEGKFRVTREIGRGGMAAVYEAENVDIGKRVAVKLLAAELITSRVVRERFIREARASAAIRSPYICDVYDSGMYHERPFLVMELLEGESLYDMMTRVRQIDVQTTLRIITHSARGLAKAHESKVVHRDLKPENIFLTQDEEGHLLAKVLDFGLAKFYEPTATDAQSVRLTREGALFGTPAYMSPEQAKGQGEVDHRADLWALGCIVYECLTGQTVWNVEQGVAMILAQIAHSPLPVPAKLRPDLPPSFQRWFERALERDPSQRFQTAKEFADTLAEALDPKSEDLRAPTFSGDASAGLGLFAEAVREESPTPRAVADTGEVPDSRELISSPPPGTREPMVLATQSPAARSGSLRAVSLLMVAAAFALGGYATWLYVLHPPGKAATRLPVAATRPVSNVYPKRPAARSEPGMSDTESEPYAKKIAEAQELMRSDSARAVETFRAAFQDGNMPAARSLLSHAAITVEEKSACRVTGISRPRPFQLDAPVSRPSIVVTSRGLLVAWIDNHQDPRRRQVFSVLLDSAMRRISLPIGVTPEASNVRQFELISTGEHIALVYWEDGGKEPGVYARLLDSTGRLETRLRRLSSGRKGDYYPSLVPTPNGEFWAVWEEEIEGSVSDLVARRLGSALEPKASAVRLTALRPPSGVARQPRTPSAVIDRNRLTIAFAKELGAQRLQVMLQTIPLEGSALQNGLSFRSSRGSRARKNEEVVGAIRSVSLANSRNAQPRLSCQEAGCFVAWNDDKVGAKMAFVDRERGPLWHREFGGKGVNPALAQGERGLVAAWFEGARLKLAPVARDGIGAASLINRVSGLQPTPDVVRGNNPGEWYVAFRDYESAHLEVFALRAECP